MGNYLLSYAVLSAMGIIIKGFPCEGAVYKKKVMKMLSKGINELFNNDYKICHQPKKNKKIKKLS